MPIETKKQIEYLQKITDQVGIIEHCVGEKPDYGEGWCVDDNARAVQVGLHYGLSKKIIDIYFNFLKKAWRNNKFYNDLNEDLNWEEDFLINGEHCGRALLALGEAIKNNYRNREAKDLFNKIYFLIEINQTEYLRVIAQTVLGLQFYKKEKIEFWADKLVKRYNETKDSQWYWFEEIISYDNGRLPMALLVAYKTTKKKEYLTVGLESLDFLTRQIFNNKNNYFSFPGDKDWFTRDGFRAKFDQQPIEAGGMTEVYCLAYKITKNKKYLDLAKKSFDWYLGKNILELKMVNEKTGGIFDGLNEDRKVNSNQGAESILSYLMAVKNLNELRI